MPKILCSCGTTIPFGDIPCPHMYLFISDVAYDAFAGSVDAEDVYRAMSPFLKCPHCGRLWVYWKGFKEDPQEFGPVT